MVSLSYIIACEYRSLNYNIVAFLSYRRLYRYYRLNAINNIDSDKFIVWKF